MYEGDLQMPYLDNTFEVYDLVMFPVTNKRTRTTFAYNPKVILGLQRSLFCVAFSTPRCYLLRQSRMDRNEKKSI